MSIAILLPAAGASSRMRGRDKLLEPVGGTPCLRLMAERALAASDLVLVTLRDGDHDRAASLDGLALLPVPVPDAALGMAHSLRAGAAAVAEEAEGLMILPPDMPALEASDLAEMIAEFEAMKPDALRAVTEDGAPGHPVIFHRRLLPHFRDISGDGGAAGILELAENLRLHALPGDRARLDLDTPEDWAAWRES